MLLSLIALQEMRKAKEHGIRRCSSRAQILVPPLTLPAREGGNPSPFNGVDSREGGACGRNVDSKPWGKSHTAAPRDRHGRRRRLQLEGSHLSFRCRVLADGKAGNQTPQFFFSEDTHFGSSLGCKRTGRGSWGCFGALWANLGADWNGNWLTKQRISCQGCQIRREWFKKERVAV